VPPCMHYYNFTENNSNDAFQTVPANVSTIADILEDKGISWGTYQEDLPYSGYEGFSWVDPEQKQDYVRKHNPFGEDVACHSISFNRLFCQLYMTQFPITKTAWP